MAVNLVKKIEELYNKNFLTLKTQIEEDTRRWKDTPCSCVGYTNENEHPTKSYLKIQ